MTTAEPAVRMGQIYADTDPRSSGRHIRVESVGPQKATCSVVANGPHVYAPLGRTVRISLDRLNSSAYRLIEE